MWTSARSLALLVLSWITASLAGAASVSAPPHAPQAGALEIGDPYFPGLGNGGYDVEHYALELETILHELAHQWFGDSVSVDRWRDLWLNEAFASYAEWLWLENTEGVEAYEQKARRTYAELRKRKIASPYDPGVAQAFSARVYDRGPFVVHGLRKEVGDDVFFRLLKEWPEANKNGNATTASFVSFASKCAGRELTPFFDAWLFADETPVVKELEPAHAAGAGG